MPNEEKKKKPETKSWFDTLGTGMAEDARKKLKNRKKDLDKKLRDMGA